MEPPAILKHSFSGGCNSGTVSSGSRLALWQTLSVECPSSTLFWPVLCVILFLSFCRFCIVFMLSLELCRCPSDLFLSSRPRTGLATTYLYMAEARSVNVKNITTQQQLYQPNRAGGPTGRETAGLNIKNARRTT